MTIRTQPPRFYIPPTQGEIREKAQEAGLKKFSRDLITDLANISAGGEVVSPSEYRQEADQQARQRLPSPDSDGGWQLSNGSHTQDREEAIEDKTQKMMKYHQSVQDFLRTVDPQKAEGSTPLEKAVNLIKSLSDSSEDNSSDSGSENEDPPLPIFEERNGEEVGRRMNELFDLTDSLDEAEEELLEERQEEAEQDNSSLQKRTILEDMDSNKEIWLRVSRKLDKLAKMKVSRSVNYKPSPDGQEVRTRPLQGLGELNRLTKSSWSLYKFNSTLFWYKAVTGQLRVREKVDTEEKKQLLYILIDASGSMDDGDRIAKAGGILFNRLKAVHQEEAEVYIRFFDSEVYEEHFASGPREAKELMERFRQQNFSGGSTEISACTRTAQKCIEEIVAENKCERPELVVITDGDDSIDLRREQLRDTKMHAFVVERENSALTQLAVQTGGVGINNL